MQPVVHLVDEAIPPHFAYVFETPGIDYFSQQQLYDGIAVTLSFACFTILHNNSGILTSSRQSAERTPPLHYLLTYISLLQCLRTQESGLDLVVKSLALSSPVRLTGLCFDHVTTTVFL